MILSIKKIKVVAVGTLGLLLIPLIAMQFTSEVVWSVGDFMVAGALLFFVGTVYQLIQAKMNPTIYRQLAVLLLVVLMLLLWAELAVGIFGTPIAGS